ncbi:MAG: hypothetical protein ABI955_08450 [Nitrospirota bacterium]
MRLKQVIFMLALVALVSGCSHRLYWLEMTPEKQVLDGYDEDQALRDHVAKLAKGPSVKGQNCTWFTLSAAGMATTRRSAYADAMGKAGPPYDALVDVLQTSISYPPLPLYCVSLEGTAVKNAAQYATKTSDGTQSRRVRPQESKP